VHDFCDGKVKLRVMWDGARTIRSGTVPSASRLSAHIIDRRQLSLLIAVVVLWAIVPTAIAQRFYSPVQEQRGFTAPVARAGIGAFREEVS
jgi:hypothetical protein